MTWRYNPPPNWPPPPPGWRPTRDWRPPADFPPIPIGWSLWINDGAKVTPLPTSRGRRARQIDSRRIRGTPEAHIKARWALWLAVAVLILFLGPLAELGQRLVVISLLAVILGLAKPRWLGVKQLQRVAIVGVGFILLVASAAASPSPTPTATVIPSTQPPEAVATPPEPATPSASPSAIPVKTGLPDEIPGSATDTASTFEDWLTSYNGFTELIFDDSYASVSPEDIDELARSYRSAGGSATAGSKAVPKALRAVADSLRTGDKHLARREYISAASDFKAVASRLKPVAALIERDLKRVERSTGRRLPLDEFNADTSFEDRAVVKSWVDGDTVDTDLGRVRLIGIDTPEFNTSCTVAQQAKQLAEQLAPPGSVVDLEAPRGSYSDKDKYGRMLRYVNVEEAEASDRMVDIGYSQLLSRLAVARYDSRDGYEWHPFEAAYRAASYEAVVEEADESCATNAEEAHFLLASSAVKEEDHAEHARRSMLRLLTKPYRSAVAALPKLVSSTRKSDADEDRLERELAQRYSSDDSGSDSSDSDSGSGGNGSSGGGGYNGPRCYAPGGKTWRPC